MFSKFLDINQKDCLGMTPLTFAASVCAPSTVKYLLAMGADPNAVDNFGRTAMHHSVIEMDKVNFFQVKNNGGKDQIADVHGNLAIDYVDEEDDQYDKLVEQFVNILYFFTKIYFLEKKVWS
jgi:ankyrin repeat protein